MRFCFVAETTARIARLEAPVAVGLFYHTPKRRQAGVFFNVRVRRHVRSSGFGGTLRTRSKGSVQRDFGLACGSDAIDLLMRSHDLIRNPGKRPYGVIPRDRPTMEISRELAGGAEIRMPTSDQTIKCGFGWKFDGL